MSRNFWDTHTGPHFKKQAKQPETRRRCHLCHGSGLAPCRICSGKGEVIMGRDHNGHAKFIRCEGCFGNKTKRCTTCSGDGWI